jgi:hypothetical protein
MNSMFFAPPRSFQFKTIEMSSEINFRAKNALTEVFPTLTEVFPTLTEIFPTLTGFSYPD